MRSRLFALALLWGCAGRVDRIELAGRWLKSGRLTDARAEYLTLKDDRDPAIRLRALVGAARASLRLRDRAAARLYLERAVAIPDRPGVSEDAYFDYAELLRDEGDAPRALNFYYRAAAGAAANRNKSEPWTSANRAILLLHARWPFQGGPSQVPLDGQSPSILPPSQQKL